MAASAKTLSPYSASYCGAVITKHLEENMLTVYKTEEIVDLQKTHAELANRNVEAAKIISGKDVELKELEKANQILAKQLKIQNQWLIRRWTEAVINGEHGPLDDKGGFCSEDEILDKNMTQLMKSLQTRVITNNNEKIKEIQAIQEDKKILLQNQSKLLAVIRDMAEFSEYPEPDRFQDHEERRMVSQSHLTHFLDHLKNKIGTTLEHSCSSGLCSSSSADLEQLKRLDGEERRDTVNDMNLLIEENDKLLGAHANLITFVQNIASFSGYLKNFKALNAEENVEVDKGDLDKLYCHVKNMSTKRSPSKSAKNRLSFKQDKSAPVASCSAVQKNPPKPDLSRDQSQGQQPILPLPLHPPKAKSPTPPPVQVEETALPKSSSPPPPPVQVHQPELPSPPKRARQSVLIAEENDVQSESDDSDDTVQLDDICDKVKAWFECGPCKLEFEFDEDLKDHDTLFHENENGQLLSYFNSDPRPSSSSGQSVGRRVVVIAEEEEGQEVEPTEPVKEPAKRKSAKIPAPNRRATRTGKRKISKNENSEYFYYGNCKK